MICVKVWCRQFTNKRILLKCDNQSTVAVLNSGSTRDYFMQGCLREILYYAARHSFEVRAIYFPGEQNIIADLLSKWDVDSTYRKSFFDLSIIKSSNCVEKFVYAGLFKFTHDW